MKPEPLKYSRETGRKMIWDGKEQRVLACAGSMPGMKVHS